MGVLMSELPCTPGGLSYGCSFVRVTLYARWSLVWVFLCQSYLVRQVVSRMGVLELPCTLGGLSYGCS